MLPRCPSARLDENLALARAEVPGRGDGPVLGGDVIRRAFAASLEAGLEGRWAEALEGSEAAGYMLCRDHGGAHVLWRPRRITSGGARVVLGTEPARQLSVQVPHPFFDRGTLPQGRRIFESLNARTLLVSGHHRCADETPSRCDGETQVCSEGPQPYGRSDVAHSAGSLFHAAHEIIHRRWPEDTVLSLHVMGDSGFSLSDGTQNPTRGDSLVARLVRALIRRAPHLNTTTCNPFPMAPLTPRLCGTTNIQGRMVNGSARPCTEPASRASGRFLHVEQGGAARMLPGVLVEALGEVLP